MGNCRCELHIHQNEEEANIDDYRGSQGGISNRPIEIISDYSQAAEKKKLMENKVIKMKNYLNQIGTFCQENDYKNLISENTNNYINNNKLNYKNYISKDIQTMKFDPIKFKNNNNIYDGSWNENNQMEGYGIYYIEDRKVIIEGVWNNGNNIFGRIFLANGDIYEGEIKNSFPDGKGKYIFSNKDIYEGDFIQGEMTGKGSFIFSDGTLYNGEIKNGIFNGDGKMKWNNGIEYNGNFVDFTLCGKGKISNKTNGDIYEGNFDKNEFNGNGKYYYGESGDEYIGNFEYGLKRGNGKYKRKIDNVSFEGNWEDDLPNGNGLIIIGDNKLDGIWRNGVFVGISDIQEGNSEIFDKINKDIKPASISILPNSLVHLAVLDSNTSQFIQGDFI